MRVSGWVVGRQAAGQVVRGKRAAVAPWRSPLTHLVPAPPMPAQQLPT